MTASKSLRSYRSVPNGSATTFIQQATRVVGKGQTLIIVLLCVALFGRDIWLVEEFRATHLDTTDTQQKAAKVLATSGRLYRIQASRSVDPKLLKFQTRHQPSFWTLRLAGPKENSGIQKKNVAIGVLQQQSFQ